MQKSQLPAMARFSDEELAIIAIILDEEEEQATKQKDKKRKWVHQACLKRETEGEFATLYKELIDDDGKFFEYFRMSRCTFNILLEKIESSLRKQDTRWRLSITPRERLAVCLRFLATGDSLKTISFSYRLGHSTVCSIVNETCRVIVEKLIQETMALPTEAQWMEIAAEFYNVWNFPNCIGAIDGKHVTIQAPANCEAQYFNDKKTFSVVLLALVDANYNFIAVDVGAFGKNSDGGIFAQSNLGKALELGTLNVPGDTMLPGTRKMAPFIIVGGEAFPLKTYLMRPYPGQQLDDASKRIFNHRLCRTRKLVESTFSMLCQKFRIYNRRIHCKPENVDYIILSTCILHNFIRKHESNSQNLGTLDASTSKENINLENLSPQGGNSTKSAFRVRELFKDYFNTDGAVSWQNNIT